MPTRRRIAAARRPGIRAARRRRIWARESISFLDLPAVGTPAFTSLTADYRTDRGIAKLDPGTTLGGIRGSFTVGPATTPAAGTLDSLLVAIGVFPDTVDNVDIDPALLHLDWLYYNRIAWGPFGNGALSFPMRFELEVRAMRKLDEIGNDIFMSAAASAAGTVDIVVQTSSLLLLP